MALAVALGVAIAVGRVYGGRRSRARADRLRRGHARHAGAAAAVRDLLRPRRPSSGCRRSSRRCSGSASTTPPTRARSIAARSRPCRAGSSRPRASSASRERQILRLVRGPQAFRLALAPMTNDFVALLKDSSLVSVITVVELTKQTQIFATNIGSWVDPGPAVRGALPGDVAAAGAPRAAARERGGRRRLHDAPRRSTLATASRPASRGDSREILVRRRPRASTAARSSR